MHEFEVENFCYLERLKQQIIYIFCLNIRKQQSSAKRWNTFLHHFDVNPTKEKTKCAIVFFLSIDQPLESLASLRERVGEAARLPVSFDTVNVRTSLALVSYF